jgi:phospholipase C
MIAIMSLGPISASAGSQSANHVPTSPVAGAQKLKHIIIVMQENRSYDQYFGTYPGARGIPTDGHGNFTVCVPDPKAGTCVKPFHTSARSGSGGPHGDQSFVTDVNNGAMDGFIRTYEHCTNCQPNDVMGYHDAREIPNYWTYARDYVLQDRMFEASHSWSLPSHLYLVSNWSAGCRTQNPASCYSGEPHIGPNGNIDEPQSYTDITYLLHKAAVSWGYYLTEGTEPDCLHGEVTCTSVRQRVKTPGHWNPLPAFTDVKADGQLDNVQSIDKFYAAAHAGRLPSVSWVQPNHFYSEHPPALISDGQAFVTTIVNAVMESPDWASSAIFVSWDDWGGFYDHLNPLPYQVDKFGYGIRVPGLVISPWAKHGYVDDQVLSHDAYNKLIEDVFLRGQRLNPATDGRPDPRPTVRETAVTGDLLKDFNFNQTPRPPTVLEPYPTAGPASVVR